MLTKERIKKMIEKKEAAIKELQARSQASEDVKELRSLNDELSRIIEELNDLKETYAEADQPASEPEAASEEGRKFTPVATLEMRTGDKEKKSADKFDTPEYRTAFMEYICRGKPLSAEYRVDAATTTTDASAVIPTTLWRQIVEELKTYGNIYNEVTKLNIQGGINIPILSLKPTAKWVGEDAASDDQKVEANTKISFSYYMLECKVAQTLLASVVTYDVFQERFTQLAAEALAQAIDIAIINGVGSTQPLGIINDGRVPSGNQITLTAADFASWSGWKKKVFAKMKKSYRTGKFYMAQSTFDGYIDGMVDSNGQPIGRVNYGIDGEETYRFGGKNVETVEEDVLKSYDTASTGDVVAVFFNPKDYIINSNEKITAVKWTDHDDNLVKNKVSMVVDGKLADANGVLIIKKGA